MASCYICGTTKALAEHHIIPQSAGGENKATIMLCPTCHQSIHHVALQLISKNPNRKEYFSVEQMQRARPLINHIAKAFIESRENPNMNQKVNLMLKPTKGLIQMLHLLKTDSGYTNIQDFCTDILTKYVRSRM